MIKCKKCRYVFGAGRRDRPGRQRDGGAASKFLNSRRNPEPKAGWIFVEDALPKESGEYLVLTRAGKLFCMPYSTVHESFNVSDHHTARRAYELAFRDVRFWMPVPDLPEELR